MRSVAADPVAARFGRLREENGCFVTTKRSALIESDQGAGAISNRTRPLTLEVMVSAGDHYLTGQIIRVRIQGREKHLEVFDEMGEGHGSFAGRMRVYEAGPYSHERAPTG